MPTPTSRDYQNLNWMVQNKYIPFQKLPGPGKTFEEIAALGKLMFPRSKYSFELALAVYDWTTADFARIQFLNLFTYKGVFVSDTHEFDLVNIVNAIWTSSWGAYVPSDPYYMNAFMMKPVTSRDKLQEQLISKINQLDTMNTSECKILTDAIQMLPRVSSADVPKLYSGQVDMNNLGTDKFATYFIELPANTDPRKPPLELDLQIALRSLLQTGRTITLKTFMSFADTYEVAKEYNNGIILTVSPQRSATRWTNTAYVTPLSCEEDKNEYLFVPGTRFIISNVSLDAHGIYNIEMALLD